MNPIIRISNLSKTYASGFQALKQVSLEIRDGEIFALLGPNGAGKTTLINIICGIVNPTEGKVSVAGHDIIRDFRAARSLIGLVPQELTTDARPAEDYPGASGPFSLGQERQQDTHAVRRHEAPGDDRQGPLA
jgi:ABC-type Mn2+/Zn2+ transport system ATPase subunit